MPSRRTILRYSKDSERRLGRWLLEHDGPDPRPGFAPGGGLVTSTGRVGHIHELQYDVPSKSYAAENKNVLLNKTWTEWWLKVIAKAMDAGKQPLLRIEPSNKPVKVPDMHIITAERHAQLLAYERQALARQRPGLLGDGTCLGCGVGTQGVCC